MPKNKVDNPRIKQKGPVQQGLKEAGVKGPRSFKGSDFRDFPRLVVQMNGPRPRPQRPMRAPEERPDETDEPSEGFARPVRGMGLGAYEGGRESIQPQMDAYRTAVHSAYADGTLSPEERQGLRQQRRGLRQGARQYKRQHPLQMGLGAKLGLHKQEEGRTWPKSPAAPGQSIPSMERMRQLQEQFRAGKMTAQQILEALGFTGQLPEEE